MLVKFARFYSDKICRGIKLCIYIYLYNYVHDLKLILHIKAVLKLVYTDKFDFQVVVLVMLSCNIDSIHCSFELFFIFINCFKDFQLFTDGSEDNCKSRREHLHLMYKFIANNTQLG